MDYTAYISGVLAGDGWCTTNLGLHVKDEDFIREFSHAIKEAFGYDTKPRIEGKYWKVTKGNYDGKFNWLHGYEPETIEGYKAWLRGFFDSEGNAQLHRIGTTPNSVQRRISMYSTNIETMNKSVKYFTALDIKTTLRPTKNSISHLGSKVVYELRINAGIQNYRQFSNLVGSSLRRKREVINEIISSYQNKGEYTRKAQKLGAEVKMVKMVEVTLPNVINALGEKIKNGEGVRSIDCHNIPSYISVLRYFNHRQMIAIAKG
ncbi:MAG: LAGLIDADG family homing endonuclease [Dehalococcoidales bacterium]|nr:LAGLIDADG family homing endonuclease [Dehalococcoidales bacterium]